MVGGYCWSRSGGGYWSRGDTVLGKDTEQPGQVEGTVLGAAQSGKQEVGRNAAHLDLQESK